MDPTKADYTKNTDSQASLTDPQASSSITIKCEKEDIDYQASVTDPQASSSITIKSEKQDIDYEASLTDPQVSSSNTIKCEEQGMKKEIKCLKLKNCRVLGTILKIRSSAGVSKQPGMAATERLSNITVKFLEPDRKIPKLNEGSTKTVAAEKFSSTGLGSKNQDKEVIYPDEKPLLKDTIKKENANRTTVDGNNPKKVMTGEKAPKVEIKMAKQNIVRTNPVGHLKSPSSIIKVKSINTNSLRRNAFGRPRSISVIQKILEDQNSKLVTPIASPMNGCVVIYKSPSSKVGNSITMHTGGRGAGNSYCQRPVPKWQKPITKFFPKDDGAKEGATAIETNAPEAAGACCARIGDANIGVAEGNTFENLQGDEGDYKINEDDYLEIDKDEVAENASDKKE